MHTTAGVSEKSNPKQAYRIPVSSGIFEHHNRIGDAVWLFLWYIDKTTKETDGEGRVLGGMPVSDSRVAESFRGQVSVKTIRRWRQRLNDGGYIKAKRTPYGFVVSVSKSKKWSWRGVDKNVQGWTNLSTEIARSGHRDRPLRGVRSPVAGNTNKTLQVVQAVEAASAPLSKAWEKMGERIGTPEFQRAWEGFFASHQDGQPLAAVMELFIQERQSTGLKIPPPFFRVKHKIEASESPAYPRLILPEDEDTMPPRLKDIVPTER